MEAISLRIGEDSPAAADRWLVALEGQFDMLLKFPRMAPCLAINPQWRDLAFGSYRIVHREIPNGVEIMRVVHGSRDIEAALGV